MGNGGGGTSTAQSCGGRGGWAWVYSDAKKRGMNAWGGGLGHFCCALYFCRCI